MLLLMMMMVWKVSFNVRSSKQPYCFEMTEKHTDLGELQTPGRAASTTVSPLELGACWRPGCSDIYGGQPCTLSPESN